MALTNEKRIAYTNILKEELIPAMGCTEPIAIAYAASIISHALNGYPTEVKIGLSGNIIKNVKSVIVPKTGGMHGINSAVCAGIISACPSKKLEVLSGINPEDVSKIRDFQNSASIEIYELEDAHPFEIYIEGFLGAQSASAHLCKRHTNLVSAYLNGENVTLNYQSPEDIVEKETTDRSSLNVEEILEFAETCDLDELSPILEKQIKYNMAIANEGISRDFGASIGRTLYGSSNGETRTVARAMAAAGSDARMNGCELPVIINSGSGNQGLTASLPVIIYAKHLGVSEEGLYRALCVSNLITLHVKSGIGTLSAYCGAVAAGAGAGCGVAYLYGGKYRDIAHTLVNALAIDSGLICDGAKASCAAKIATAVENGLLGFNLFRSGNQFFAGDGIVKKGVENTISSVARLANQGMRHTDKEILNIMLEK